MLAKPNAILKHIFETVSNQNQIVFSTACLIISHILKYTRERKKEEELVDKEYISDGLASSLIAKIEHEGTKSQSLALFGCFIVIQELLIRPIPNLSKMTDFLMSEKCIKIMNNYLSNSEKSRLEEMRNLEGSNYGVHSVGYYDPAFLCYHRLIVKIQKEHRDGLA